MDGYSRSFCMWSIHHRGTVADPGLVLALDEAVDGFCDGVAFFVPPETAHATIDYLRERELISSAYLEKLLPIALRDGRAVDCVAYVIDEDPRAVLRWHGVGRTGTSDFNSGGRAWAKYRVFVQYSRAFGRNWSARPRVGLASRQSANPDDHRVWLSDGLNDKVHSIRGANAYGFTHLR